MKKSLIIALSFLNVCTFAQPKLYRLSGMYVSATNMHRSADITASEVFALDDPDEILHIENSIQHSIPEFYFTAEGEYGVTNWVTFPNSPKQVGSEFKLEVWKTTDNGIRLSTWGFKYCYFIGWNTQTAQPEFDKAGQTQTDGANGFKFGKNSIVGGTGWSKDFDKRGWLIVRIDKVDTPSLDWVPADTSQIRPITGLFKAIRSNDAELLITLCSKKELEKLKDWTLAQILELIKAQMSDPFESSNCDTDDIVFLYAGNNIAGTIKFTHKSGVETQMPIVKINDEWKLGE